MTWFKEWFDKNYLDLYADRDSSDAKIHADLITQKLGNLGGKWLDVGCGDGRYTAIFREKGYVITGIDISPVLIEEGKKKYPELDIKLARVEDLFHESIRYQVILSLFTSFGYFEEDQDNLDFLQAMGDILETGGQLWLDFLNAEKIFNDPLIDTISRSQSGKVFHQRRRIYFPQNHKGRIEKEIEIYNQKNHFVSKHRESVRLFTLKDFSQLLPQAGFKIKKIFGSYNGEKLTPNSPRLIIWGEKSK